MEVSESNSSTKCNLLGGSTTPWYRTSKLYYYYYSTTVVQYVLRSPLSGDVPRLAVLALVPRSTPGPAPWR